MKLTSQSRSRIIQFSITALLGLILMSIISVYIIVGMKQAPQANLPAPAVVGDAPVAVTLDVTEIEAAEISRRMKILDGLVAESSSSTALPEREQQLAELMKENQVSLVDTSNN